MSRSAREPTGLKIGRTENVKQNGSSSEVLKSDFKLLAVRSNLKSPGDEVYNTVIYSHKISRISKIIRQIWIKSEESVGYTIKSPKDVFPPNSS